MQSVIKILKETMYEGMNFKRKK